MKAVIRFIKKETVLSAAWILAIVSAFVVPPSSAYIGYIDFRSLGILWGMMVIMAGLKSHGFFALVGRKLLDKAKNTRMLVLILVFLCFFFSMLITNDVSLLTFVPFTITLLSSGANRQLIIPVVVLQTLAANLGSMLTPIGNPQNLYLYGVSGMGIGSFLLIMLPYTAATAVLLLGCCIYVSSWAGGGEASDTGSRDSGREQENLAAGNAPDVAADSLTSREAGRQYLVYGALFVLAMFTVLRVIPWFITAAVIFVVVFLMEREILLRVDYALLATFIGFFIFTGNMGNVPAVSDTLSRLVQGNETILGVLTSQVISNVPAALLLSGFTENYRALIIGVNLGGLGTLIASMASLISYKFVASELPKQKGRYFLVFTAANVVWLLLLMGLWIILK